MHCHFKTALTPEVGVTINPTSRTIKSKWLSQGPTATEYQTQSSNTGSLIARSEVLTTSLNSFSFLYFLSEIQCRGEWLLIRILKLLSTWVPLIPSLDSFMPTPSLSVLGSQVSRAPAGVQYNDPWWGSLWTMMTGVFERALAQASDSLRSSASAMVDFHKVKQIISSLSGVGFALTGWR